MLTAPEPEHTALIESAERFIAARYPRERQLARVQSGDLFNRDNWREIADHGWLATDIDEANGGLGLGLALLSRLAEALAPAVMLEPFVSQVAIAGHLLNHADGAVTAALRAAWLDGKMIVALAHHEGPTDKYFAAPIAAMCDPAASQFVINGDKTAVIDGAAADTFIVSVRASAPPHAPALLVVPRDAGGVTVTCRRTFDGRNLADVTFRDVRVAHDALLFCSAEPMAVVDAALERFAFLVAAESLGVMLALTRLTYTYLTEREQFGQKLAGFQVLQHRLVDMLLAATRSESLIELVRVQLQNADHATMRPLIAAAKLQTDEAAAFIGEDAIQLHGAIGMTDEYIAGHYFKRLTANRLICGGRTEYLVRAAQLHA